MAEPMDFVGARHRPMPVTKRELAQIRRHLLHDRGAPLGPACLASRPRDGVKNQSDAPSTNWSARRNAALEGHVLRFSAHHTKLRREAYRKNGANDGTLRQAGGTAVGEKLGP
jgi:hypothetical protein